MSKPRISAALALGVAAATLLSGCAGSADPGVAIRVGDETISNTVVDEAAGGICLAFKDQFTGEGQTVPMSFIRQGVIQLLTLDSQARQIAEEYDVTPDQQYNREVASVRAAAEALPEDVRADYVKVMTANALANSVVDQVGRSALKAEGVRNATVDQVAQKGQDVFAVWPDANGVEIDPRYGLKMIDGVLEPVDTNLSVAVGETARTGMATDPDPAYAAGLPAGHRCG